MRPSILLLVFLVSSPSGSAQWASDAAVNLSVGDGPSDQNQPKLEATSGGGAWVSWFDGIASGWDVRIQLLDAGGNEQFPHNGILVADRGFSSTQDYGLDLAANGDALLAYRDDSGANVQIEAQRASFTGIVTWGGGIQVSNTTAFVAAPKIAGTSDGGAVVAWTQDTTVVLQKLDASGSPQWGTGVVLTPGTGSYSVSDLHADGNDAVLSFVHQTGGFGSPRRLRAQKFDATGALQWGAAHVPVFSAGTLQFGNFPSFVPDGAGGGVFAWYDTSTTQFQCYVQRVLSSGVVAFAIDGVEASTNATRTRVEPSVSFDTATGDTLLFWTEQAGALEGVYGQRFDSAGNRLWGAEGTAFLALGTDDVTQVRGIPTTSGAVVSWCSAPTFGTDVLSGVTCDAAGTVTAGPFDVASFPSGKARLAAAASAQDFAILAWSDARVDGGDILVQNVNPDGSLGEGADFDDLCSGDGGDQAGCTDCPCGNNASVGTIGGCLNQSGTSARLVASGSASVTAVDPGDLRFELVGGNPATLAVLVSGDEVAPQNAANPCFGLESGVPSAVLDGLRCAVQSTLRHGGRPMDSNGDVGLTNNGWGGASGPPAGLAAGFSAGATRYFQVFYRADDTLGCLTGQNTTQAIRVEFTP